jgi:hypothetical protein
MRSFLNHLLIAFGVSGLALPVGAAGEPQRIYRCGNAYTNQPEPNANCKALSGGTVTVIEGTRIQAPQAVPSSAGASGVRVDHTAQRQRDAHAQVVLQAELLRTQKQQADLLHEWQNGTPERRADEHRQPDKYQRRVAELRAALQRNEADIAGLQRELARLSVSPTPEVKP